MRPSVSDTLVSEIGAVWRGNISAEGVFGVGESDYMLGFFEFGSAEVV